MSGIEQSVFGFDAASGKVFKKEKEKPSSEAKKYPAFALSTDGKLTEIKEKRESDKSRNSNRLRRAMVLGVALSAAVAAGIDNEQDKDSKKNVVSISAERDAGERNGVLSEQDMLKAEEEEVTREVFFSPNEETVILNATKEKELVDLWMNKYRTNPKLKDSLVSGYKEMGKWQKYLEQIFIEEGVPTEYMYLALAESHWQPNAVSRAGATGPYQFMPKTARLYDLKIGNGLNECKDPLKSARACAQLLHDLHEACGDWNLALAGYNGGHLWRYIKEKKASGEKMSHEDFLKFLEKKINNVKSGLAGNNYCLEIGLHNNSIRGLAKKFHLGPNKLCQIIGIPENSKIIPGDIKAINIPMGHLSNENREKLLNGQIRGLNENRQYPAKGIAINNLIKEGEVTEQKPTIKFKEIVIKQPQQNWTEGVKKIAKKKKKKQPTPGYISLTVVARNNGNTLKEISELNPGLELGARIPDGYRVRIKG